MSYVLYVVSCKSDFGVPKPKNTGFRHIFTPHCDNGSLLFNILAQLPPSCCPQRGCVVSYIVKPLRSSLSRESEMLLISILATVTDHRSVSDKPTFLNRILPSSHSRLSMYIFNASRGQNNIHYWRQNCLTLSNNKHTGSKINKNH